MDDGDNPIYETGYYEPREEELLGMSASDAVEPVISHGGWGWLYSAYAPVYDAEGNVICHVGCDVDMNDIMQQRRQSLRSGMVFEQDMKNRSRRSSRGLVKQ